MTKMYYHTFLISKQTYLLAATDKGLAFVGSADKNKLELEKFYPKAELIENKVPLIESAKQLTEYLTGVRKVFTLHYDLTGTKFQELVWKELFQIPYGETINYTQLAQRINHPKAVRAVGTAIGRNPLLMVIPCHRVITKTGSLGGYRGGLVMKQNLLKLEGSL